MSARTVLNLLAEVFLENGIDYPLYMGMSLLFFAGLWGMFRKCGLKGWYALVPCLREVKMGEAAGRERDGRVLAVGRALNILINMILSNDANSVGDVNGDQEVTIADINAIIDIILGGTWN